MIWESYVQLDYAPTIAEDTEVFRMYVAVVLFLDNALAVAIALGIETQIGFRMYVAVVVWIALAVVNAPGTEGQKSFMDVAVVVGIALAVVNASVTEFITVMISITEVV